MDTEADEAVDAVDGPVAESIEVVSDRHGPRVARVAAIIVGIALVGFIAVLATGKSSADRFGPNPLVGRAMPKVVGTTLAGEQLDVDRWRQKWIVVNFVAAWCVPCQEEHPELVRFEARHKAADDARVVSVAFDDRESALRAFFDQRGGDWPVIVGDTGPIALDFGVTGVPESFVVAPSGVVVAHFTGVTADGLDDVIDQVSAR